MSKEKKRSVTGKGIPRYLPCDAGRNKATGGRREVVGKKEDTFIS